MKLNAVRYRKLPWGPDLPWRWVPRLCRGGRFGPERRQEWMLWWGWWRWEFFF